MKNNIIISIAIVGCVITIFNIRNITPSCNSYSYENKIIIYPLNHWKDKVSSSCMNCKHMNFITKHWDIEHLRCENCKAIHIGKIDGHYKYDKVLMCKSCKHVNFITGGHNTLSVKCIKCKEGHFNE